MLLLTMDYGNVTITFSMAGPMKIDTNPSTKMSTCTWSFYDNKLPINTLLGKLKPSDNNYPRRVDSACLTRNNVLWVTDSDTEIETFDCATNRFELSTISKAAVTCNVFESHGRFTFLGVITRLVEDNVTGKHVNVVSFDHVDVELDAITAVNG